MEEKEKEIMCDFCDNPATMVNHEEKHLKEPRKINVCNSCHSRIHFRLLDSQIYIRLKVPKSALPLFQRIYPNIVSANGELIFSGEEFFKSRYEVIEDSEWLKQAGIDICPELKEIEALVEKKKKGFE